MVDRVSTTKDNMILYMYGGEMECMGQSFACTIGLHALNLACLSSCIASNFEK
jgi:hypothetical protein